MLTRTLPAVAGRWLALAWLAAVWAGLAVWVVGRIVR